MRCVAISCLPTLGSLADWKDPTFSPLLDLYPKLSWDAEGRLRNKYDELDVPKMLDYIRASYIVLDGRTPVSQ